MASCAAAAVLIVTLTASGASATNPPPSATGWRTYPVPVSGQAVLDAVTAPGAKEAWAGGFTVKTSAPVRAVVRSAAESDCQVSQGMFGTVMLHWTGGAWQKVVVPASGRVNYLSQAGAADVWAVTDCGLLHYNGHVWATVNVPQPSGPTLQAGVQNIGADRVGDAWLVGATYDAPTGHQGGFVDHWNGKSWLRIPLPALGTEYALDGVAALSPANVWIAGVSYSNSSAPDQLILLHWNGHTMTKLPAPGTGMAFLQVSSLTGVSASNVWLAGWGKYAYDHSANRIPLMLHWNGTHWFKTPVPAGRGEILQIALTHNVPWAVGDTYSPSATSYAIDVLRWDGSRWVHASPPMQGPGTLDALVPRPGGGLWAVGSVSNATGTTLTPVIALHS